MEGIQDFWMHLRSILLGMHWNDLLDIVFVSFIIYKAIQLLRNTRAAQLFKGILIIAALYVVVRVANLEMMQMLFDNVVLQVGVFSVIVIFQQEIRRAIEQIGKSSISSLRILGITANDEEKQQNLRDAINAAAEACQVLRTMKMGALMVFEGKDSMEEVIRSGTVVDAKASMELIGNVFFNKAPLHDGAMILRDGRVHAAGCILPLTQNVDISSELGTRHRAAIGVSESSDAVVVVVSEETGNISIAQNGHLTRNYTKDTLRSELEKILLSNENGNERRLFSKPLKKKENEHE